MPKARGDERQPNPRGDGDCDSSEKRWRDSRNSCAGADVRLALRAAVGDGAAHFILPDANCVQCQELREMHHVFGEFVRLEHLVQEARGTMRSLQTERDVAQRIAENIQTFHTRALGTVVQSA